MASRRHDTIISSIGGGAPPWMRDIVSFRDSRGPSEQAKL